MSENASPHPLRPFQQAFAERKEAHLEKQVALFVEALEQKVPDLSRADLHDRLAQEFDETLAALVDENASALRRTLDERVTRVLALGLPAATIQRLNITTRKLLLEEALKLPSVPGRSDGIRRLLEVTAEPIRRFDVAYRKRAERIRMTGRILEEVIANAPDALGVAEPGGRITQVNPALRRILRIDNLIGRNLFEIVAPVSRAHLRDVAAPIMYEKGHWTGELTYLRGDGTEFDALVTAFIVRDENGADLCRCAIVRDLSQAREAEAERQRLANELIAAQKAALEELGTPLVPVAEGVLVMPLIGTLDAARAERMLNVLLEGIEKEQAKFVLVDVTGAKTADAEAAAALARAAQGARLLGSELLVTGISPDLAKTLVELEAGFGTITTKATLGDGVLHALRRPR